MARMAWRARMARMLRILYTFLHPSGLDGKDGKVFIYFHPSNGPRKARILQYVRCFPYFFSSYVSTASTQPITRPLFSPLLLHGPPPRQSHTAPPSARCARHDGSGSCSPHVPRHAATSSARVRLPRAPSAAVRRRGARIRVWCALHGQFG
jgi:hypothetical protein